ncbi:zinc finger Y-chromosomal protein 1-like, partial [Saccoglossus kowalevskii]
MGDGSENGLNHGDSTGNDVMGDGSEEILGQVESQMKCRDKKKILKCKKCSREYLSPAGLFLHMKVHMEKKFMCNYDSCNYGSYYKGNLEKHIATVHEKKPPNIKKVSCKVCYKMYTPCRMKVHIRMHT